MDLLELMKYRRSIRRYTDRQVAEEDLLKILEAGAYAPNAGGGQRSRFVACQNKALNEAMGKLNLGGFDRSRLMGGLCVERTALDYRRPFYPLRILWRANRNSYIRPEKLSLLCAGCFLRSREHGA